MRSSRRATRRGPSERATHPDGEAVLAARRLLGERVDAQQHLLVALERVDDEALLADGARAERVAVAVEERAVACERARARDRQRLASANRPMNLTRRCKVKGRGGKEGAPSDEAKNSEMVCTPNRSRNFSHTSARARVSESVEAREENEKHEEGGTHQACSRCRTRGAPRAACRPGSAGARGGTAGLRACSRRQPVVFCKLCVDAHRVTAQAETRRARGPCTRKTRDAPSPTY